MNTEVQEASDKSRERLPETEVLLRNHDLNILVIEAFQASLAARRSQPLLKAHRKLIENLATEIDAHFKSLENSVRNALALGALPNLALRLKQSAEVASQQSSRPPERLRNMVESLESYRTLDELIGGCATQSGWLERVTKWGERQ